MDIAGAGLADKGQIVRPLLSEAKLRIRVSGKFIFLGDRKFHVRGVTYGTFRPDADGNAHGIEVSELVDQETLRQLGSGLNPDWKEYDDAELTELVLERIKRKEKLFNEPPTYVSKHLILFSDEPDIAFTFHQLANVRRPSFSQFDEVWILFPPSPSPDAEACQLLKIAKL